MRCQNSLAVLCRILPAPPDCVQCGAPAILVLCVTKEWYTHLTGQVWFVLCQQVIGACAACCAVCCAACSAGVGAAGAADTEGLEANTKTLVCCDSVIQL